MGKRACLVRGSINVDEYFHVSEIARPGETIGSHGYDRKPGGKGANGAVAIAKAGGNVDFAGLIGNDAEWLRKTMSDYGVGVDHLRTTDELPTGRAFIQVSKSGENSIVLLHGANHPPSFELPPLSEESYSHILLQNEIPFQQTYDAILAAKGAGTVSVWNPSPIPSRQDLDRVSPPEPDWLIVNQEEAAEYLKALGKPFGADVRQNGQELAAAAARRGVIVTLGSEGALLLIKYAPDGITTVEVPPGQLEGKVVDTTGAGDCFTGFFVAQLLNLPDDPSDEQLEVAVRIACQAATMCVEEPGTMDSVPSAAEVRKRVEANGVTWPS